MSGRSRVSVGANSGNPAPEIQIIGLSAPVRHTLQALTVISNQPELCLDAGAVARKCGLPEAALSKSFQCLARRGLLESRRGPGGGYRLAMPPEKVTLAAVAAALGAGEGRRGRCLLEERVCRSEAPCLLHAAAVEADERLGRALRGLTLADLAAEARKPGRRS